jgi:hypothetical protein
VIAAVTAAQVATIERMAVIVFMSAFPIIRRYGGERPYLMASRPGRRAIIAWVCRECDNLSLSRRRLLQTVALQVRKPTNQ